MIHRSVRGHLVACFSLCLMLLLSALSPANAAVCAGEVSVCKSAENGGVAVISSGTPVPIYADGNDDAGVLRAAKSLQGDLAKIGGKAGAFNTESIGEAPVAILVGTISGSSIIKSLVESGKLDISGIEGKREAFIQQVVATPIKGVDRALVIAGSDKRGAIFGIYDLSRRAGVSPWAWWADVPVKEAKDLFVTSGRRVDMPMVRYRGIFLNDENPALYGWVNETFGGFNHQFYEKVFELILRQKGNFLWPAMWGKAFYDDDPQNAVLANEMGVVISTSHHEPMMRAHVEWDRYGEGPWDYTKNAERLSEFWREGVTRMGDTEGIITVGMRGDGDEAMTEGTAIDLLETIVRDQRKIIGEVKKKSAEEVPQVWALYKEVQDYYDKGMKAPEDITLLFADDNWGNIRRLPPLGENRPGGYGVYYHFDYVGGPRNYKWLNTTQIERVWEQMHIAHEFKAHEIWIVNVGDLKPMEFPISFFLDYAWDPDDIPLERMSGYTREWAAEQFGEAHADKVAELLTAYTKYNARRKPELVSPETYSLIHFEEADRVLSQWKALVKKADALRRELPSAYDDAFVQLVWFPIHACANLNALYVAAAKNRLYAVQGRASTNDMAREVERLFAHDAELTRIYHEDVASGKWNHMMSQTHIGYTYWQQPEQNNMPEVTRIDLPRKGKIGVAIDGSDQAWPGAQGEPELPVMDVFARQRRYIDIFNKGEKRARFTASASEPWVTLSRVEGSVDKQTRIRISADWDAVPAGRHRVPVTVKGSGKVEVTVYANFFKPEDADAISGFVETDGLVTIEAANATRIIDGGGQAWRKIPELSKTGDAMTTLPSIADAARPAGDGPRLEYDVHLFGTGDMTVEVTLAPTLDFKGQGGMHYAVSIDDQPPVIVNVHEDTSLAAWETSVATYAHNRTSKHKISAPGDHTVKLWAMDPALVFQRIDLSFGEAPQSYLGGPESAKAESRR